MCVKKSRELISADSCCPEARTAGREWLKSAGTEREAAETAKYIRELEEDILPIDALIAFMESPAGTACCGAETAGKYAAHGRAIKAAGAKYCDCPACAAAAAILAEKERML